MKVVSTSVPVPTVNIESALARYQALLGVEVKARFVIPERRLTVALLGDVPLIGGAERDLAPLREVGATFTVDSLLEEFEAHLRDSGATILQPPTPTPAGRTVVVRDVEGVVLELVEVLHSGVGFDPRVAKP
jgi:predicted enzyme related to lactoylglutathione lyase